MPRLAHFKTIAKTDGPCHTSATVTIDRASELISVRPRKRRRTYTLPLSAVAEMIVYRVIRAEVLIARKEKAAAHKADRGSRRGAAR